MTTEITKAWVVQGTTGEYSDRREWIVCVFLSEAEAKDYLAQLEAWACGLGIHASCTRAQQRKASPPPYVCPLDPQFQFINRSEVDYFVSCEAVGAVNLQRVHAEKKT